MACSAKQSLEIGQGGVFRPGRSVRRECYVGPDPTSLEPCRVYPMFNRHHPYGLTGAKIQADTSR